MSILQYLRRIPRIPRRIDWLFRSYVYPLPMMASLWLRNICNKRTLIDPNGPVVSLTTYGRRTAQVYLTIESIGRGVLLPSRIILWLDEKAVFKNLPPSLRRLAKRGLEVRFCENFGPHKKYFPFVSTEETFSVPLVTADDDELYPETWLSELVQANLQYPNAINCRWAVQITCDGNGIGKYSTWARCGSVQPDFRNFALGISGVIYPPEFLLRLKEVGTGFKTTCPMADDVWLHVQGLRAGYKVRQIKPESPRGTPIPGSQATALTLKNFARGNDVQIAATYRDEDLAMLRALQSACEPIMSSPNPHEPPQQYAETVTDAA